MQRLVLAVAVTVARYIAYQQVNRPPYALEVDATKDTIDIGIQCIIK